MTRDTFPLQRENDKRDGSRLFCLKERWRSQLSDRNYRPLETRRKIEKDGAGTLHELEDLFSRLTYAPRRY